MPHCSWLSEQQPHHTIWWSLKCRQWDNRYTFSISVEVKYLVRFCKIISFNGIHFNQFMSIPLLWYLLHFSAINCKIHEFVSCNNVIRYHTSWFNVLCSQWNTCLNPCSGIGRKNRQIDENGDGVAKFELVVNYQLEDSEKMDGAGPGDRVHVNYGIFEKIGSEWVSQYCQGD